MRRIGIDVGGTNTDAVIVDGDRIVGSVKTPTTEDVMSGITEALRKVLHDTGTPSDSLDAVMIGTTHFTNAVAQRRDLSMVAAIRICLPASASLEPFIDWPDDLAEIVRGEIFMLAGRARIRRPADRRIRRSRYARGRPSDRRGWLRRRRHNFGLFAADR